MSKPTKLQLIEAFQNYEMAHRQLTALWASIDSEMFTADYPFEKSFEELHGDVKQWAQTSIKSLTDPK